MRLPREEIERIARWVHIEYGRLPEFEGRRVTKVDPEIIAERILGQSIEYHKLSITGILLGASCPGMSDIPIYDDGNRRSYMVIDENTIFIDSYLLRETSVAGRYHFTLAHEISHKLFWRFYPESIGFGLAARRIRYCKTPMHNVCPEERDADALAAAILMPPLLIRRKMEEVGLNGKIPLLNSVFAKDDYGKFCAMAEAMGVSKKALCIRMQQFGLVEKEYLYNPYDLINVYMTDDFNDCDD